MLSLDSVGPENLSKSFSDEFEFETSGCKTIVSSLYWRLLAIFLQPLTVSNCLFIDANYWKETQTNGCKKVTTSGDFLTATSLELKTQPRNFTCN